MPCLLHASWRPGQDCPSERWPTYQFHPVPLMWLPTAGSKSYEISLLYLSYRNFPCFQLVNPNLNQTCPQFWTHMFSWSRHSKTKPERLPKLVFNLENGNKPSWSHKPARVSFSWPTYSKQFWTYLPPTAFACLCHAVCVFFALDCASREN